MMSKVNVGCGMTPVRGWKNYDNSMSLFLARHPFLFGILKLLKLANKDTEKFVNFVRINQINYANAAKLIPEPDNTVEVLYSSHMLEHLRISDAKLFLKESRRVLVHGGTIRISVPDLRGKVEQYLNGGNADKFMSEILLASDEAEGWRSRLKYLITGVRGHQWMYDGKSLCEFLFQSGFKDAKVMAAGTTAISESGDLDLFERSSESVYVEAINP